MNALDTLRLFSDGRMSAHEQRSLMLSMGFTQDEFGQAFATLAEEAGSSIRVSKVQIGEMQAELYLTVRT